MKYLTLFFFLCSAAFAAAPESVQEADAPELVQQAEPLEKDQVESDQKLTRREAAAKVSMKDVYKALSNLTHPSWSDWGRLQYFLRHGERNQLRLLESAIDQGGVVYNYHSRMRGMKLIGRRIWQRPRFGIVPMNCAKEDKDRCVIVYASYNQNFPRSVYMLRKQLEKIGFKGHFLYRIGGWPDLEGGSLTLAHVPYAFKPAFFNEAQRLGYKNILWLDASVRPIVSLDSTFEHIERTGYYLTHSGGILSHYCSKEAVEAMGLKVEDARYIPVPAAGIVGFNVHHPVGRRAMEMWLDAAHKETPFFSPRCDQSALAMVAHLLQMSAWEDISTLAWSEETLGKSTRFYIDYDAVSVGKGIWARFLQFCGL